MSSLPWTRVCWVLAVVSTLLPVAARADAQEEKKAEIAIMPFDTRKVDTELTAALMDTFQIRFARASERNVIGQQDIASLVTFEQQKSLMGCDSTSCLTEIGGALGVRYLVIGRFARVGNSIVITVKLMDVQRAQLRLSDQEVVASADEQALLEGVQRLAVRFGEAARKELGPRSNGATETPPPATSATTTSPAPSRPPPAQKPAVTAPAPTKAAPAAASTSGGGGGFNPWQPVMVVSGLLTACAVLNCCLGLGWLTLALAIAGGGSGEGAGTALVVSWLHLFGCTCCGCLSGAGWPTGIFLKRRASATPDVDTPPRAEPKPAPVPVGGAEEPDTPEASEEAQEQLTGGSGGGGKQQY
ncbi:MAG: hypothetical protein AB2A00_31455 [Myxococcota bacterium]